MRRKNLLIATTLTTLLVGGAVPSAFAQGNGAQDRASQAQEKKYDDFKHQPQHTVPKTGQSSNPMKGKGLHSSTYTVKKGDTFWGISRKFHLSLSSLLKANSSVDPLKLQIGAVIYLTKPTHQAAAKYVAAKRPAKKKVVHKQTAHKAVAHAVKKKVSVAAPSTGTASLASRSLGHGWSMTHYNDNGITKSGAHTREGVTLAVDPRYIPLGSTVRITYPNGRVIVRKAQDTGGAIKGKKLDLYVNTSSHHTMNLGVVRNCKVEIIN